MTRLEFDESRESKPCIHCGLHGVELRRNLNNNGLQVVCSSCESGSPWGGAVFIQQSSRKRREPLPNGVTLDSVWAEYDNRCIVCTQPRETLKAHGIGQQCHHVLPYSPHGHKGRIVPVCTACHEIVNALQRTFTRFTRAQTERGSTPMVGGTAA